MSLLYKIGSNIDRLFHNFNSYFKHYYPSLGSSLDCIYDLLHRIYGRNNDQKKTTNIAEKKNYLEIQKESYGDSSDKESSYSFHRSLTEFIILKKELLYDATNVPRHNLDSLSTRKDVNQCDLFLDCSSNDMDNV